MIGSVDGTLAQQNFAGDFSSVDTWHNFSLSWDSVGRDLSQAVTIAIGAGGNVQYVLDSVSLSSAVIPEPGAFMLLATGLIGLLAYAWRRRR